MKPKGSQGSTPADNRRDTRSKTNATSSSPSVKIASTSSVVNWVECSKCCDWIIFENSGIKGPYDEKKIAKEIIECKLCKLLDRMLALERDNASLRENLATIEKIATDAKAEHQALQAQLLTTENKLKDLEALNNDTKKKDERIHELNTRAKTASNESSQLHKAAKSIQDQINQADNSNENPTLESLTASQVKKAADEFQEIERRKHNVIVWGLPEKGDDKNDLIMFANNAHYSLRPMHSENILSAERLGRSAPNKTRMLKVKLDTAETKKNLLNLHRLRRADLESPKIFIRPDLTKQQQESDKRLREEWAALGKDKFTIRRGRIVPRIDTTRVQRTTNCGSTNTAPSSQVCPSSIITARDETDRATYSGNKDCSEKDKATNNPLGSSPTIAMRGETDKTTCSGNEDYSENDVATNNLPGLTNPNTLQSEQDRTRRL